MLIAPAMVSGVKARIVDTGVFQGHLDDARPVALIVDGEVAIQFELVGVLAQQPCAEAMKRADPHTTAGLERLDALTHLAGGLIREGDGQDVAGPNALLKQIEDAARDDARFAAAGAGEDEQRSLEVRHRLALRRRQIGE